MSAFRDFCDNGCESLKKKGVGLCLALALLLCGCGAEKDISGAQTALDFRKAMLEGTCAFEMVLAASYDEEVYAFTVQGKSRAEEGTDMTITAPEILQGLCAHVDEDGAKIVFEDTEAGFGPLGALAFSPMAAPQKISAAWREGHIEYTGREDGMLRVSYLLGYGEQALGVDTWFEAGIPIRAELSCDGVCFLQAEFLSFSITPTKIAAPGAA